MLKGIPQIISPELLKVLSEMGVTVFDESSDERVDAKIKIDRDGRGVSLYGSDGTMLADFYHIVAAIIKSNASNSPISKESSQSESIVSQTVGEISSPSVITSTT